MDEQNDVVVTLRVEDCREMAAGSTTDRRCNLCREFVVVSPSSQRLLEEAPDTTVICMRCMAKVMNRPYEMAPVPGSLEETRDVLFTKRRN